ncbi:filamentous haemagglutinin family protein [Trinickia fusca]|nr:filamentous haemagglutinin family protein [Trinickia fusca]
MLVAGISVHAHAGGITNLGQATVRNATAGAGGYGGAGMANLGVSPQQALQASQPSIRNLGQAARTIAAQIAAQQSAAAAGAGAPSTVPNGLAPGGLQVAPGASSDPNNPVLWYNANAPIQSVDGNGHVTVDIKQTGQNSVLTWQTMNVGRQTTLNFDQSGGNQTNGANNWAVLNRINDPSGQPSQILGNITAQGSVYVINRNGVLFGAGSQVNVHSLVASSLNLLDMKNQAMPTSDGIVLSNQQFLSLPAGTTGGLAYPESGSSAGVAGPNGPNEVLGLGNQTLAIGQYVAPGDITIAPGASITTHTNGTVSDGGFVMIAAPNVTNGGSITATSGQVVLAAGVGVSLRPNSVTPANPQILLPELSGEVDKLDGSGSQIDITPAGTLTNTGIVQAARGNVNLLGSRVAQNGVVGVTTSVNTPGNITISTVDENVANNPAGKAYPGNSLVTGGTGSGNEDQTKRTGLLSFGSGSVTTVMPDGDGETATSTPGTVFTPGSINMTAGSVWFQGGSLIEAPGSNVSVAALTPLAGITSMPAWQNAVPGRIYVDNGATIDVSGLANVERSIADTLITVPRIGQNELADSPLLRNGFLYGVKGVVADSTLSGTRSDGLAWVGSPILNLSGYASLIPRSVDQLLTNGGTVTLSGNEVMTATGSSMNLNGGYVHYDGGMVNTTRLVDANGAIVPIGQASPYDTYVGIAGEFTETHPRWGVTKLWYNPLQSAGVYEPDYIVGGNAGTLDVFATNALVLDGAISAQAFGGSKQMQTNNLPTGGTFNLGSDPNLRAADALVLLTKPTDQNTNGESGTVILQGSAPQLSDLAPGFSIDTPLNTTALKSLSSTDPNNVLATTVVPVDTLNAGGFSNLYVGEDIDGKTGLGLIVARGTQLNLQAGGAATFNVLNTSTVLGSLTVPSGKISFTGGSQLTVGAGGHLSVAGQWVNNDTLAAGGTLPGNSEFINGGSITLSTGTSVDLQPGSFIDVSSGGEMQANGKLLMNNGIAAGTGGSLSVLTGSAPQLDGTIRSFGFAGGGTLTLSSSQGAGGFQIGGDPATAPAWAQVLPTDFFERQGFGNYVLNAAYDTIVAPGSNVRLTQQNLIPDPVALQQAASGTDLSSGGLTTVGTLDAYHRQPTSLVLTAGSAVTDAALQRSGGLPITLPPDVRGAVTIGQGASIVADAGASIGLGSPAQVTVLGALIAPGGSIALSADTGSSTTSGSLTTPSKSVWLGPDAVLDVAGTALVNPLAAPVKSGMTTFAPNTGKVLRGGTVTISDSAGYVVAQTGSRIDVSGASAQFDEPQGNGTYASQPVWSDAGSITLAASSGLLFDGTLAAHPGASLAQGGTLTLLPESSVIGGLLPDGTKITLPGATALVLQQDGQAVPAGLAPGQNIVAAVGALSGSRGSLVKKPTGVLTFSVDRLTGSGISSLVLGDSSSSGTVAPVPVAFAGNVDVAVPRSVQIYTDRIAALNANQLGQLTGGVNDGAGNYSIVTASSLLDSEPASPAPTTIGSTVTLDAPYVALVGPNLPSAPLTTAAVASDATLNVNASFIDLENQFRLNNFGQANFTSGGDIRMSSTSVLNGTQIGALYTPGNLTFKAADVYPSTGSTFILDAVGATSPATSKTTPTTIAFESNGVSAVPLSAGGSLLVDATNIVQAGTVSAPSGALVFGVGDPTSTATKNQFGTLPLVATNSVTLASGSVTSVSNRGAIIPYGTTVDGVEWRFNPTSPDVTAPPAKYVGVNGASVSLAQGATIDLSGGGNLQAVEWVPGTGGSRDVLSQYNVSYATNAQGAAVPVNVGAANVYAIVPGTQSPIAAYDPIFAQTLQPKILGNGTTGTVTSSLGVGQVGLTSPVGQSVYLSGVPGLAPGYYTLLPAKYATLPGAFRVTVANSAGNVAQGATSVLPDGTVVTAGYFADALTGSRSATPTLFNVQAGPVWQQYSQYTLTSANDYFPALAAKNGNVTPPLPLDGGHLVLAANKALTLGATLNTAAGMGGAPAEVDIASQDIQITGNGGAALPGYLQIGADALDSLDAGSLLIGGTRTATPNGMTITPIANSVVVSTDAGHTLSGPEVMLVTKTDTTGSDSNAANGLRVDAGSVIKATGSYPGAKDGPVAIAGDGALLSVSNGAATLVTRTGATGTGLLSVGAGATLAGGAALTLDSSGNLKVDPTATLSAKSITVDGSAITFTNQTGPAAANLPGFVVGPATLAQLANAQQVILRSAGAMNFVGNVAATFGNNVDLSAGTFVSDGGAVTLNAPTIAFTNETGATPATTVTGHGNLTVNANEIDFGTGNKTVSGFGSISMNATGGIVGQGTGTFDFGTLPVTLAAPAMLADTGSGSTVKTQGVLTLTGAHGSALTRQTVGGAWQFIGGSIGDNGATITAPAGNVSLEATSGNVTIGSGATIRSAGVAKQFFDVTQYAPAGAITLTADAGTVDVQTGSTLDFSGAQGGGAAGSLSLSAPQQVVNLNGTLKGGAASGYAGGSFSLNTGGAANLDSLASTLTAGGVNDAVAIHTRSGNLTLSQGNTLTAQSVSLMADGGAGKASDVSNGNVLIGGTIDASGYAGGQIALYGKSSVDIEGTLLAKATDSSQRGGKIDIGTSAVFDPSLAYNATYGYENIARANSGRITLGGNALIDVTGGTSAPGLGGTVNFRAPLLNDGGVNVALNAPATAQAGIKGSRKTTAEAYATWSTLDATTGAQHFDGLIDPAGWYDGNGNLLAGTFTVPGSTPTTFSYAPGSATGGVVGTLTNNATHVSTAVTQDQLLNGVTAIGFAGMMGGSYFVPTTANGNHTAFYGYQGTPANQPGTLMAFVQHGLDTVAGNFVGVALPNFNVVPGIELDNPSSAVNSGNITVLSNWNLGAGSPNNSGSITPDFRYQSLIAPVLTFRAVNDFDAHASITDGFYQSQVAKILGASGSSSGTGTYTQAQQRFSQLVALDDPTKITLVYTDGSTSTIANATNNVYAALSAPLTGQTPGYYSAYLSYASAWQSYTETLASATYVGHIIPFKPSLAVATPPTLTGSYTNYTTAYWGANLSSPRVGGSYLGKYNIPTVTTFGTPAAPTPPTALLSNPTLSQESSYLTDYGNYMLVYGDYENLLYGTKSLPFKVPKNAYNLFFAPAAPGAVPDTGVVNIGALPGNAAANVPTAGNPLPIAYAALLGGQSSSYRIVSGADFSSADPVALAPVSTFGNATGGSVTLSGHTSYIDTNGRGLVEPVTIRTGTGDINIAAADNISLFDKNTTADATHAVVPGVIYTAGAPAQGSPAQGLASAVMSAGSGYQDILVTPSVNPDSAGDVTIHAQRDVTGLEYTTDTTGALTGTTGSSTSQYWWPWMEITASPTIVQSSGVITSFTPLAGTSIDFGAFDQGIMSVGGNVAIDAGRNVSDLGVSLPTTWYLGNGGKPVTVGGGNLTVRAGGDILSGDYFVAKGTGTIRAGGSIGADISAGSSSATPTPVPVSTVLAVQDGKFDVTARQGIDIGSVLDPSYSNVFQRGGGTSYFHLFNYGQYADGQSYSATSAVNLLSTTGDVRFGTLDGLLTGTSGILPASVNLTAFDGGITLASGGTLYPSAGGQLNLIADQSVNFSHIADDMTGTSLSNVFSISDADPSQMPSPTQPPLPTSVPTPPFVNLNSGAHAASALHGDDTSPAHIYSLNGSIVDGSLDAGKYDHLVTLSLDKPALIEAGQDIMNLAFQGQNLRKSDITRVVAGRDIYDTPLGGNNNDAAVPSLLIGGPGTFDVEAGRNIGPLTNPAQVNAVLLVTGVPTGINAVGNANNANLPHESANVNVLFGVGPGVDVPGFLSTYVDPASSTAGATSSLISFMEQYNAGKTVDTGLANSQPAIVPLTATQAWTQFKTLPQYVQQLFAEQVLFGVLAQVARDYNNPSSLYQGQYARGYQAINTLFPSSLGYTANNLGGGSNGANQLVHTGDLDIRSTTIQTQQGGNITILGPGGQALVGSTSAPPQIVDSSGKSVAGPGSMGILTLEKGDINIFTDQSVLLAQSRIFTEQGGNMTIWSSNGDINAGKGSKSVADTPAPQYVCDANHYCTVDTRGEVVGAGIATLQTVPGAPSGDANLVAPRGTVDAGDAGIRVSGNLNVAALHVANADNIQTQGTQTGIPVVQAANTGALTAASSAASAANQMAQDMVKNGASGAGERRWTITVQVEGFGDTGSADDKRKSKREQVSYDPSSAVSVVGFGSVGQARQRALTKDELAKLGNS